MKRRPTVFGVGSIMMIMRVWLWSWQNEDRAENALRPPDLLHVDSPGRRGLWEAIRL